MQELVRSLNQVPLAGLMLVVTLGFSLGRLQWRGMSLGPAGGTLLVAILLGANGLSFRALYGAAEPMLTVGGFGFALFIYSVGFEAGPRFFSSLKGGPGWRFVAVGTVVNVLALGFAVLCGRVLGLSDAITAGLLSGALTSAPTYAAAAEVCSDTTALAVSFAVIYPVGLVGVVLLIEYVPRLMGDDLTEGVGESEGRGAERRTGQPELTRAFEVASSDVAGRTLAELDLSHRTGCYVTMIHRGTEIIVPRAETTLETGDHALAKGRLGELQTFAKIVGPEIYDQELRNRMPAPRRLVVMSKNVIGRNLRQLDLARKHGCLVVGIERGGVRLDPSADVPLERADVLDVVGSRGDLRKLAEVMGRYERPTHETDIAVYAGGIFLGLLLGRLGLGGFGLDVTVGTAGGLLFAGILLGRLRTIGPFQTHVPRAARQLVRDLGILLFVAETGVKAGESLAGAVLEVIFPLLGAGLLVTALPVLGALIVARRILHMRPVDAWGSISGGMTSSAALVAVRRAADSNEAAVSYAASYAVASVLVTIAGQVVVYLM
ncbi:MAG: aspartate-alanine antiporter-like transporter [Planctomycetota bacterium]|jgi:putative transport protein